jgi:hypothetical protein
MRRLLFFAEIAALGFLCLRDAIVSAVCFFRGMPS